MKTDLVSSSEAATKGQIDLGALPVGVYYLVETDAPAGHNLRTDPVVITVSANSVTYDEGTTVSQSGSGISQVGGAYQLTVTNDAGVELRLTGGPGTGLFAVLGTLLVPLAGAGFAITRSRRKSAI